MEDDSKQKSKEFSAFVVFALGIRSLVCL